MHALTFKYSVQYVQIAINDDGGCEYVQIVLVDNYPNILQRARLPKEPLQLGRLNQ